MKKNAVALLCLLSLASSACVVTTTTRDVGSVAADGSVYLGWHLIARDNKSNVNDEETYDVGAQLGNFSALRLHADKPIQFAQVLVIFANGERWVAPAPPELGTDAWSQPIPLPGGPRAIHSVVVTGKSATSLLARLEIHGVR